jgi:hypothetical protein
MRPASVVLSRFLAAAFASRFAAALKNVPQTFLSLI